MNPTATAAAKSAASSFPVWPLLTAVLVVLKLLGLITISWLWVFSPLWLPLALVLAVLAGIAAVALIVFLVGALIAGVKLKSK